MRKLNEHQTKLMTRYLTEFAVRNTFLEDLHAGKTPSSKKGDYSDVKVVTPYGEIKWNNLSRLSDEEMRKLMLEIEGKIFKHLDLYIHILNGDLIDLGGTNQISIKKFLDYLEIMYRDGVSWDISKEKWEELTKKNVREITIELKNWNIKTKYKCPECSKAMYLKEGKYICDDCQLQVQFTMKF